MSVKGFERSDGLFSLCGLNRGLCEAIIDKADRETANMELADRAEYIKREIDQLIKL